MIYVRCDGGASVGLGHATRCLAIAELLSERTGEIPCFLAPPDPVLARFFEQSSVRLVPFVGTGYGAEEVAAALTPRDLLLSDTYSLDQAALATIGRTGATHCVIDDFASLTRWPVALVVNPNVGAETSWYLGADIALVGPKYALLRSEIRDRIGPERQAPPIARKLVVCLGGGAWPIEATALLSSLAAKLGGEAEIRATTRGEVPAGVNAVPPESLAAQLAWAELAVLSAGVVKYEAAALGAPQVLVAAVPHQADVARSFAATGAAHYLGALATLDSDAAASAVGALANDAAERARLAAAGKALIDGRGAELVADALLRRPV